MVSDRQVLEAAAGAGLTDYAVVIREVGPREGPGIRLEAGRSLLYPASMIKVPLVAAVMVDVADGRLGLADRVEVDASNLTVNDAPSPLEPGYHATLQELCDLAISRSDNVATNVLFDVVGRDHATSIARERLGLSETAFHRKLSGSDPLIFDPDWDGVHRNVHTAADAARLFDAIALDRMPHARGIRAALERQYWNGKLTNGLRAGDRFLHKTGDTDDVTHDGGILTTSGARTYVVVVYTGMASTDTNNAKFAPFMQNVRSFL